MPRRALFIALALALPAVLVGSSDDRTLLGQSPQSADAVIEAAGTYLRSYEHQFSAVVSEERYEQVSHGTKGVVTGYRVMRSDLLLVNSGDAGWLCFRDVYEVDGKAVRDRSQRLMDLFQHPTEDAVGQATRIREEGARYNLGRLSRTVNDPTIALAYLRTANQLRSSFESGGDATIAGIRARIVRFKEQAEPRLIHTGDDSPATGRFWIDETTGRVLRTELTLGSDDVHGTIVVNYGAQSKLAGMWVPVRMEEHHVVGSQTTIDCVATYANFRQFNVSVK